VEIVQESPYRFTIPRQGRMRVPGIVFATRALIPDPAADRSLEQVANVAELPGIVTASYAMPDVHWGYGFPIGGVAATDVAGGGAVSPGGVGCRSAAPAARFPVSPHHVVRGPARPVRLC
jgi:tRNA-splicing ligase RtcB (3'-phosphate/5'-hydroxy nucleic acid ligase)